MGADTPCTVAQLARTVAEAMGAAPRIEFLAARREVQDAFASHEKARRIFDPPSPLPLAEGVARMAEWARRVGSRKSKPIAEIEVSKNLPLAWLREKV